MAVTVTHTTAATGTDSGDGLISKDAWNEGHTVVSSTLPGYEFDFVQITSLVSVTGTAETSAGSTLVITGNSVTYDGSTLVEIEFFSPAAAPHNTNASDLRIFVMEGTTYLGRIAYLQQSVGGDQEQYVPVIGRLRLTPTAGSHTYLIRASRSVATGTIQAGAGGATNNAPAYMRIARV